MITLESVILILIIVGVVFWLSPSFFRMAGYSFGAGLVSGMNTEIDHRLEALKKKFQETSNSNIKEN